MKRVEMGGAPATSPVMARSVAEARTECNAQAGVATQDAAKEHQASKVRGESMGTGGKEEVIHLPPHWQMRRNCVRFFAGEYQRVKNVAS